MLGGTTVGMGAGGVASGGGVVVAAGAVVAVTGVGVRVGVRAKSCSFRLYSEDISKWVWP